MVNSLRSTVWRTSHYLLLGFSLLLALFPMLWMFRISFLSPGTSIAISNFFSSSFTLENYRDLFVGGMILRPILNSLLVGGTVTLGNILLCFMVGYTLARYRSLSNKLLFVSIIVVLMIPAHIIIIPLYLLLMKVGWYDTYFALIVPWLVNPLGIFLVKQYIEGLPSSMEEAARIDGAGELTILVKIVMPLCRPALAVLAIQVFFTNWNSFLFPYILTSSAELRTLPVALSMLQGHQAIDWQHLMAGSALAVIPVVVLFLIMQKQLVSGITAGGIKQ